MDKEKRVFELLERIGKLKELYEIENQKMLKIIRETNTENQQNRQNYNELKKLFSTANKYLNEAHSVALLATKRPTYKSISDIENKLIIFDDTWQNARHYSMIGMLTR